MWVRKEECVIWGHSNNTWHFFAYFRLPFSTMCHLVTLARPPSLCNVTFFTFTQKGFLIAAFSAKKRIFLSKTDQKIIIKGKKWHFESHVLFEWPLSLTYTRLVATDKETNSRIVKDHTSHPRASRGCRPVYSCPALAVKDLSRIKGSTTRTYTSNDQNSVLG